MLITFNCTNCRSVSGAAGAGGHAMNTDNMSAGGFLVKPRIVPPLDQNFRPAVLANRKFRSKVAASGKGVALKIAIEAAEGTVSTYEMQIFPADDPRFSANFGIVERTVKFLLCDAVTCTLTGWVDTAGYGHQEEVRKNL